MIAGVLLFAVLAAAVLPPVGAVTDAQVDVEVASSRPLIDRCVLEAAGLPSMPTGAIGVRWQIAADGTSSDVVVLADTLALPKATACVTAAVANLRFPAAPVGRSVERTLEFPLNADRGLSREAIQRVVSTVMPRVKRCYDDALAEHPTSAGTIRFVWTILGTGEVGEVRVEVDTLARPEATACMRALLSSLRYPRPKGYGVVNVTYPFVFSTGDDPRSLSRRAIDTVIWSAMPRINRCYEEAIVRDAPAAGAVRLTWKILDTGAVKDVLVDLDTLALPATTACLRVVVASLQFPAAPGRPIVQTANPFVFPSTPSSTPAPSATTSSAPTSGCGDWWRVGKRASKPPPSSSASVTAAVLSSSTSDGAMRW